MNTIKYLENNIEHNLTSFQSSDEASKHLFAWQYVCSRLLKVSSLAPQQFQFTGDLNQGDSIQGNLFEEYLTRKSKIDINSFTQSSEIQSIPEVYKAPETMNKDYLLLDLLLTQKIIKDKGIEHLSDYGQQVVHITQSLINKDLKDVEINIQLIDEIMEKEKFSLHNHSKIISELSRDIQKAQKIIAEHEETIKKIQSEQNNNEAEISYISPTLEDSPNQLDILKRNRQRKYENSSLVDKLKLQVFSFLGKNTHSFYNDNLESIEQKVNAKLAQNSEAILELRNKNQQNISSSEHIINTQNDKVQELETILQAQLAIKPLTLTLGKELLDDFHARDVKRVSRACNNIFIHSINNGSRESNPEENSPIHTMVSFEDKVNQIRCFAPEISCSSFQLDSNSQIKDFTAPMGVIISSGSINSSSLNDAGTIPDENGLRGQTNLSSNEIENVITQRSKSSIYDEHVISNPKVHSLYLNYDRINNIGEQSTDTLIKTFSHLLNYSHKNSDIPIVLIKDGNIHQVKPKLDIQNTFENFAQKIKYNADSVDFKQQNEDLLKKAFYVSDKKEVDFFQRGEVELSLEDKLDIGKNLIQNYQPKFQRSIKDKLLAIETSLQEMQQKLEHNNSKKSKQPNL